MKPEELSKKRKQYFGEDQYDMNGRKKAKLPTSSAVRATKKLVSKVAKKLSPKKAMKKLSPKKMFRGISEKRKVAPIASDNPSERDLGEPVHKRMKHPPAKENNLAKPSNLEKEVFSLKSALNVAQAEIEVLKSEKTELLEDMNQQETQIRMEVSQEMEERLRVTRQRNNEELERLRSQINGNQTLCRSSRKAHMDKAEKFVEELMDKVDECEEEMVRMRQEYDAEVARLQLQMEESKASPDPLPENAASKKIVQLEKELAASRHQVERLEKSKIELVENYEQLLKEAEESEDEEEAENAIPLWKQKFLRSKKIASSQAAKDNNIESRPPLGTISGNIEDSAAEKDWDRSAKREKWIFPKKTSSQDELGTYKRPSGRAPHGREWDASVGAWQLNAV
jgi:hypothetical protein